MRLYAFLFSPYFDREDGLNEIKLVIVNVFGFKIRRSKKNVL